MLSIVYHRVAAIEDIPNGQGRAFEVGRTRVAVFNDGGSFFAIDDACPHMGASLAEGALNQHVVTCPLHAWRFDIRDGTWCDNRRVKIGSFPVDVRAGEIWVGVPDNGTIAS